MSKEKGKDIAIRPESEAPAYIKKGEARGSENVDVNDLIIPRLTLLQQLSPELVKTDPAYIEGAEAGQFVNSLTREVYEAPINIVPIFYRKEYVVFKDRKKGGGFKGSFPTEAEAANFISNAEDGRELEITDTAVHFCFIVHEDGSFEEVVISMTSTKMKVSRQLNSLVRMRGADRWAGVYSLGSVLTSNDMGSFYNFTIANNGWASEEVYAAGEKVYNDMDKRSADHGGTDTDEAPSAESDEF